MQALPEGFDSAALGFLRQVRSRRDVSSCAKLLAHLIALDYWVPNGPYGDVFEVQFQMVERDMSTDRRGVQSACRELNDAGHLEYATDGQRLVGKLKLQCRGHPRQFARPASWGRNVIPFSQRSI